MAPSDVERLAILEHRANELDGELGKILAAATRAETLAAETRDDVKEIRAALEERPSAVEFQRFRESVRAKAAARSTLPSLSELEFRGPTWLGGLKIQGYSGVTLVIVVAVVAIAGVAYLILK